MPRSADSGQIDLAEVFARVQYGLLADLNIGRTFEHATSAGNASEQLWLDLFTRYLPKRFSAAPVFVINSAGRRSRQIDLAIYDNYYSPLLFPHSAGNHVPIESVCAVFEIKSTTTRPFLREAGEKAASVRALQSRSDYKRRPILAGFLAPTSMWKPETFKTNARTALNTLAKHEALQYGCALEHGAFERITRFSSAPSDQALIFFLLRLIDQLNTLAPPRPTKLLDYLNHPTR